MIELLKGLGFILLCFIGWSWACFIIGLVVVFGTKLIIDCWRYLTQ